MKEIHFVNLATIFKLCFIITVLSLFILNRPPVFANYFENYMVVKEVMKEMFSGIFGPKNILGSQF